MEGIEHNFFENNRAYASIFRAVAEEKSLGTPLTIQLLDCWVRQWLSRKGFETNEDIEELMKLVGSLTDALFVLLCCLPKRRVVRHVVRHVRFREKSVTRGPKYPKELLSAVRKLQSEKIRKNSNCSDLDEDDHDKVPDIVQVNISQKALGQPTDGNEGQYGSGDEQEDDSDASNDQPASMMEFSLDIADEPKIVITEAYDMPVVARINVSRQSSYQPTDGREGLEDRNDEPEDNPEESSDEAASEISLDIADEAKIVITEAGDMIDSQQLDDDSEVKGSGLQKPLRGCHVARRVAYLDKLINGGSFKPGKHTRHNGSKVDFAKIRIHIRVEWELRPDTDVKIKVELAETGSDHRNRYATHTEASAMARRLAFRLSGITLGGKRS